MVSNSLTTHNNRPAYIALSSSIYSINLILVYLGYMAMYYSAIKFKLYRRSIIILGFIFFSFCLFNLRYLQPLGQVQTYIHLFGSIIVLLSVFLYFEQLRNEITLIKLSHQPMVWISFGIFMYHLLTIPFLFSLNYLNINLPSLAVSFFYVYIVILIISVIFYLIAFLCPQPQK